MFPFVETIRVNNSRADNLKHHQARMNHTRREIFGITEPEISLEELLKPYLADKQGLFKCRVEYRREVEKIEFLPYQSPIIHNLMMIEADTVSYPHKSTDRHELETLRHQAVGCSDVLIIRNGLVTDTSFCNVAFFDGYHWITPRTPLLRGTQRALLLEHGMLIERDIPATMVREFKLVMLFNAMNEFGAILLPTHEVYGFNH